MVMKKGNRSCRIFLGDLTYYNKYTQSRISVPLNLGYITAYLKSLYGSECDVSIFKNPEILIAEVKKAPPDVLGLSCYHWNQNLDILVAKIVKGIKSECLVVIGGPNVDIDADEQYSLYNAFNGAADMLVMNDGEQGFANIILRVLSVGIDMIYQDIPIDGCVFFTNEAIRIAGKDIGMSLDLSTVPSPILSGILDNFLVSDFSPMLHTSRGCPYNCAYCAHGKFKEKIRTFPVDLVKEEIHYIAAKYSKFPHKTLIITDDNFGIKERDVVIAQCLVNSMAKFGYPQQIHTYFDKSFTTFVRKTASLLAGMNFGGLQVGFQSFNIATLNAIKRGPITDEKVNMFVTWAKENNFEVSCDLIYGLPYETKESFFASLEYVIHKRIDQIIVMNLQLIPGSILSKKQKREEFGFITKYRPLFSNDFGIIDGNFVCESQEVVVSSSHASFEDYIDARKIMLLVYIIWAIGYFRKVFDYLTSKNYKVIPILEKIMSPSSHIVDNVFADSHFFDYITFIGDYVTAVKAELHDSEQILCNELKTKYDAALAAINEPTRINVYYGSRMVYSDNRWFGKILLKVLLDNQFNDINVAVIEDLIRISDNEWVNVFNPDKKRQLNVTRETLTYLGIEQPTVHKDEHCITMSSSQAQINKINSYVRQFKSTSGDISFYYNIMDNIVPRRCLRYEIMSVD
ncbi:radical SAM domain-containing protein [Candidatus Magnetobacterium bavaricum]|uniref:Radical SAM domain-containing protein n=1 Tax=Candidatus Magnetobacterium bavaricum TaxID=29290 RepID=A0A0F3GHK3_9BACT|nr:radical SAM domain-containing protein [Candidatus Magnetobacterium bavaricum]